ncbi:MAG: nucleotidyl transferase AbiEii/AbiGii toxin family protein [Bacteroidota bacterium]
MKPLAKSPASRERPRNLAASIRARLLKIAKEVNRDYNSVLLQYFQERFLFRLSRSAYRSQFILKGALLFIVYQMPRARPTRDIDFLGQAMTNDPKEVQNTLKRIADIQFDDGVTFNGASVSVEKIKEETEYEGVRAKIEAELGGARNVLQLDIGFGDKIIGGPVEIEFPVLLDPPAPKIQVYSKESALAEKFEAIVRLSFITSRMKDFYDILYLASHESFNFETLHEAIIATFDRRETPLGDRSVIFGDGFKRARDKQEQWQAFLTRSHLESYQQFAEAVEHLRIFLDPVCSTRVVRARRSVWHPESWEWRTE